MPDDFVTVAAPWNSLEAELLCIHLRQESVSARIHDLTTVTWFWYLANAFGGAKVQVIRSDLESATRILERGAFQGNTNPNDAERTCRDCDNRSPVEFAVCWKCGAIIEAGGSFDKNDRASRLSQPQLGANPEDSAQITQKRRLWPSAVILILQVCLILFVLGHTPQEKFSAILFSIPSWLFLLYLCAAFSFEKVTDQDSVSNAIQRSGVVPIGGDNSIADATEQVRDGSLNVEPFAEEDERIRQILTRACRAAVFGLGFFPPFFSVYSIVLILKWSRESVEKSTRDLFLARLAMLVNVGIFSFIAVCLLIKSHDVAITGAYHSIRQSISHLRRFTVPI